MKYVLVNTSAWKGGPISAPWLREAARIGDTAIYEVRTTAAGEPGGPA